MGARVKICGISTAEGYDAAARAGADWVGFVFFAASPRAVTPAQAAALVAEGGPAPVGLFVDPTDDVLAQALDRVRLAALQVHASPARAAEIRARFGLPVWRSVPVAAPHDLPDQADGIDVLLVEPRAPAGATRPGGNAIVLDLTMLSGWRPPLPWLLAGGLTPVTVGLAIAASGAPAVDVSSGVESAPGVKDPARIAAFVAAARSA